MQRVFRVVVFVAVCLVARESLGQSEPKTVSLCVLQKTVAEGDHANVRVSGLFREGLERGTLRDAACPAEATWVELALRSKRNREKLRRFLDRSQRAYVVVEGDFYGPPVPDSKLPESIRKTYHPGWGHLGAFSTKLVVHKICEVQPASGEQ